jgi:prepilin-type N-terminal cleavage/methylation domain-containing protein/prepilin-type processing-associated H-X9-DG protein
MKKAAFTLIELLVVITVIAILAGIALPVYGKVLEKSRATTDGANLKQLGLGIAAYLNDNDEQIFSTVVNAEGKFWPEVLQTKYVPSWKVFKSPFDKRGDGAQTTVATIPVSYGINKNVLTQQSGAGNWNGNFSKVVAPSQLVLMAPAMTAAVAVPTFTGLANTAVSLTPPTTASPVRNTWLGTHNARAQINVLFADTHVSTLKYGPSSDFDAYADTTSNPAGLQRWKPLGQ